MKIVDQGLVEWIKARVEVLGSQGYNHDYELLDSEGKCLVKWHGMYQSDPHGLAILIYHVAWTHGGDEYKVVMDRKTPVDMASFDLKVSRAQGLLSEVVYDEGLVKLYKWYDALAHRVKVEKIELHHAAALTAWERSTEMEVPRRQDCPSYEGEWVDLARPNDELIADVYLAAHHGLERLLKHGARIFEDDYSVLCFIDGNPVPEKYNVKIPMQFELMQDKDFKLDGWGVKREGAMDNNKMMKWVADLQKQGKEIRSWTLVTDGRTVAAWGPSFAYDTTGQAKTAQEIVVDVYAAAYEDPLLSKEYVLVCDTGGAVSELHRYIFTVDADPETRKASTRGVWDADPSRKRSTTDWIERAWPLMEDLFGAVIHQMRHPERPDSFDLHAQFMTVHAEFLKAQQAKHEAKQGIYQAMASVLPAIMNGVAAPTLSSEVSQAPVHLPSFYELETTAFLMSLDPQQYEEILSKLGGEQKVRFQMLYEVCQAEYAAKKAAKAQAVPGPVPAGVHPAWCEPKSAG